MEKSEGVRERGCEKGEVELSLIDSDPLNSFPVFAKQFSLSFVNSFSALVS